MKRGIKILLIFTFSLLLISGLFIFRGNISNLFEKHSEIENNNGNQSISEQECFQQGIKYTDMPGSKCAELIPQHNNPNKHRVNLIFVGINFGSQQFYNKLQTLLYGDCDTNGSLKEIPFVNNLDKFNFWFVPEIKNITLPMKNDLTDYQKYVEEVSANEEELMTKCDYLNLSDRLLVRLSLISRDYPFHSNTYDSKNFSFKIIGLNEFIGENLSTSIIINFLHEFGHAFGDFLDEYNVPKYWSYSETVQGKSILETIGTANTIPTSEKACEKWCSGKPVPLESLKNFDCSQYNNALNCSFKDGILQQPNDKPCIFFSNMITLNGKEYFGCVNTLQLCLPIGDRKTCESMTFFDGYTNSTLCVFGNYLVVDEKFFVIEDNLPHPYFQSHCLPLGKNSVLIGDEIWDADETGINIGTDCISETGCYMGLDPARFTASITDKMKNPFEPFNKVQQQILEERLNQFGQAK